MIDNEKVADGPGRVTHAGVRISSRYGKRREMELMISLVNELVEDLPALGRTVRSVYCDSKACDMFSITIARRDQSRAAQLCKTVSRLLCELNGGHNGVCVETAWGVTLADADPVRFGDLA